MIPAPFDYHAPGTLAEAVALLAQHAGSAKVLSGGQSLLPLLKLRLGAAEHLVDIGRIPGLDHLHEKDGYLVIGAGVRESALEESEAVAMRYPILLDTARVIADPLVRNRATVCGNIAHGDPGNDHPATMIALGAKVVTLGPRGERVLPIEGFFRGLFTTALEPDEILTELRIPTPPARSGGAYFKLERKVGDYATAAAAVQITLGDGGKVSRAGIALTNVGPTPVHCTAAQQHLTGQAPTDAVIAETAKLAAGAASPNPDRRGSAQYKKEVARVLTERALRQAIARAGGR